MVKKLDKRPFYVQVMGVTGKEFQEVEGTPIWIKGAEDADLFLHRSVAGGGWRVSSGVTGMYVSVGGTKKQAVDDASQKGKPEAIMRTLKQYLESGEPVSPRASELAVETAGLDWGNTHIRADRSLERKSAKKTKSKRRTTSTPAALGGMRRLS